MTESTTPITGYRTLSEDEIVLMNKIKAKGIELGNLVDELEADRNISQRWVRIGKDNLQQGLMALTRAVAQPTTF